MSDRFKFRAWDGENMHYDVVPWHWDFVISRSWHKCEKSTGPGLLGSGGKTGEFLVPGISFSELMQFTGMRLSDGTEVFEGDIVEYGQPYHGKINLVLKGKIVYNEFCGAFQIAYMNMYDKFVTDFMHRYTVLNVIGNIHQHKHLLE